MVLYKNPNDAILQYKKPTVHAHNAQKPQWTQSLAEHRSVYPDT